MEPPSTRESSLAHDLAKGVVAGVAATAAMVGVRNALYAAEDPVVRSREEALRQGAELTPLQRPVRKLADAAGMPLDKEKEKRLGNAAAWGLGIAGVTGYALLRRRFKGVDAGQGLGFGFAMWALEDEFMMSALGFSHPPQDYPWQAHARGLAAHLTYGVAAETALDALDRVYPP